MAYWLGFMSRFAWKHLTITPSKCIDCRLCEVSCPFDYISKPNTGLARENRKTGVRRLGYLFAMMPVLIVLGGWIGHRMSIPMSSYNNTVFLAEQVLAEQINPELEETLETETYRAMGMSEDEINGKCCPDPPGDEHGGLGSWWLSRFGFQYQTDWHFHIARTDRLRGYQAKLFQLWALLQLLSQ